MTTATSQLDAGIYALPKAELHLHMEGSMEPSTVVALAARYGDHFDESSVAARYATRDFLAFIEAYKWVTSYLRTPQDYAVVVCHLAEQLLAQNVVYAEITLSVGVMLLRKQDVSANFRAILEAAAEFEPRGLRIQWIFDAVRQFGPGPAMLVAQLAAELRGHGVVAFGMGGDELSVPASAFQPVYEFAASHSLHRLIHAGEIGGPDSVRDAIEVLGAERIGHGIAAAVDPRLMATLAERSIHLEICPTSNVRTGALARQLGRPDPSLRDHPLPKLVRAGVPVSVSTDDPAMFETTLSEEYSALAKMGLDTREVLAVAEAAFAAAFLPPHEKTPLIGEFRRRAALAGLL